MEELSFLLYLHFMTLTTKQEERKWGMVKVEEQQWYFILNGEYQLQAHTLSRSPSYHYHGSFFPFM